MKRALIFLAACALAAFAGAAALADTDSARAIGKQASAAIDAGQYSRGVDLATAAITADGDYEYAYYLRAFAYRRLGKYADATQDLNRAESLNASDPSIFLERGRIYSDQERYADAQQAFTKAATLSTTDSLRAQSYQGRADAESYLNDYRAALDDAKTALQFAPKDTSILSDLANYAYGVSDYAQSKVWLYRAVILAPKDSWSYDHLGIFYYSRKQYDASLENFNKALALSPKSWATHNRRAMVYTAQGKFEAALRETGVARGLTKDATPILEQGLVYWSMGRYPQAKQALEAGIQRKSDGARYYLGLLELGLNENAAAAAELTHYIAANKGNAPDAVMYSAIALRRMNDPRITSTLANDASWKDAPKWPAPIRSYLQGTIPADALYAEATSEDQRITAKTIVALNLLAQHRDAATAKADLRWVLMHARRTSEEYRLAATTLK